MKYELILCNEYMDEVSVDLDDLDTDFNLTNPMCQKQLAEAIEAARTELQKREKEAEEPEDTR